MPKFPSTLLPQSNDPKEIQKAALDLLDKINQVVTLISALPAYADNATALAAGLKAGDFYRIGDTVGVVH